MRLFIVIFLLSFSSYSPSETENHSSKTHPNRLNEWSKSPSRKHSFLCQKQKDDISSQQYLFVLTEFYNTAINNDDIKKTGSSSLPYCLLSQNGKHNFIAVENSIDEPHPCFHRLNTILNSLREQGYNCQDWGFLPSNPERYAHKPEILHWLFKNEPIKPSTIQTLENIANKKLTQKIDNNTKKELAEAVVHGSHPWMNFKVRGALKSDDLTFMMMFFTYLIENHLMIHAPVLASNLQKIVKPAKEDEHFSVWRAHDLFTYDLIRKYIREQVALCMADTQNLLDVFANDKDASACFQQRTVLENGSVCGEEFHYLNFRITKMITALEAFEAIEANNMGRLSGNEKILLRKRTPKN